MFVKGMSEASKMGGHKFAGCAVEKKTHSHLGNVTALNLRNYLVSLLNAALNWFTVGEFM